jgi:hypothetical protein
VFAAFSLRQESPDLDPGRRTPHFLGGSVTSLRPVNILTPSYEPWDSRSNPSLVSAHLQKSEFQLAS